LGNQSTRRPCQPSSCHTDAIGCLQIGLAFLALRLGRLGAFSLTPVIDGDVGEENSVCASESESHSNFYDMARSSHLCGQACIGEKLKRG
jgi:hypothetical protein